MKRLHPRTKIFFKSPYVVRMEYPAEISLEDAEKDYRKLTRRAYRLIAGTWGYCSLEPEMVKVKDEFNHPAPPGPGHFAGMPAGLQIASLFDPDYQQRIRGYLCFKDELDALQFRLTISTAAIQVRMWPERWFTIHEVVETDES
jgi:hypothetical protein